MARRHDRRHRDSVRRVRVRRRRFCHRRRDSRRAVARALVAVSSRRYRRLRDRRDRVLRPRAAAFALYFTIAVWAFLTGILEIAAAIQLRKQIANELLAHSRRLCLAALRRAHDLAADGRCHRDHLDHRRVRHRLRHHHDRAASALAEGRNGLNDAQRRRRRHRRRRRPRRRRSGAGFGATGARHAARYRRSGEDLHAAVQSVDRRKRERPARARDRRARRRDGPHRRSHPACTRAFSTKAKARRCARCAS